MPNFFERVIAVPASLPAQLSGALPAGCVAGYAPAIPSGQLLILDGPDAGVWNVNAGAWTKEAHDASRSVQCKVTQGDMAGWYALPANGTSFSRL